MADIKITDLVAYTDPVSTDVLPIVDVGNDLTKKVSIADLLENAGTGSAAAPSFSFDGDSDTGIYRPGANQVALTAGGTQALLAESTGITIPGNLTVSGTTTTVDTVNLTVKDKNIELGVVSTPSNTTADGGGITLKGATDKTINWVNSTGCWTFNQPTNFNDHVRIDSSGNCWWALLRVQTFLTVLPQDLFKLRQQIILRGFLLLAIATLMEALGLFSLLQQVPLLGRTHLFLQLKISAVLRFKVMMGQSLS